MASAENDPKRGLPNMIYGTAWKEEATEKLVLMAIKEDFSGIDTANQRRHYFEEAVGDAIDKAIQNGVITREELFIQTKYTYPEGQDHRIPYDVKASYSTQVRQSFQSSLEHLRTDHLDSYLLHGPSTGFGLTKIDWEVWRAMEEIKKEGGVRYLGVSNVNIVQLEELFEGADVKPTFVQNRCFALLGWDKEVREFCSDNNMVYQGFSLLTANGAALSDVKVRGLAARESVTPAQLIFSFALHVGMMPLTGTTSRNHMREDLDCVALKLSQSDVRLIESIAVRI